MQTIKTEIMINAPVARVWSVLTNFSAYSEWNPFITHIDGTAQVNQRLAVTIAPEGGKPMRFRPIITSLLPQHELKWKGQLLIPGIFDGHHVFQLEQQTNQQTRFIHREEFSGILHWLIIKKIALSTQAGFNAMNQAFKIHCESNPLSLQ